jgi:tRNA-(ms[2]io[6]A)-hydroxylase
MLGLELPTDPRWAEIAETNLEEILIDHAYCEQKAASTAISLIVSFPEYPEMVSQMSELAQEEMSHFKMVYDLMQERGIQLGKERKDQYVGKIIKFFPKGGSRNTQLIHRLLVAGLIEARSCERFRLLSEKLTDQRIANFYRKLMISEANHYTLFLKLARQYGDRFEVDQKWKSLLAYEAEVMKDLSKTENIHG